MLVVIWKEFAALLPKHGKLTKIPLGNPPMTNFLIPLYEIVPGSEWHDVNQERTMYILDFGPHIWTSQSPQNLLYSLSIEVPAAVVPPLDPR